MSETLANGKELLEKWHRDAEIFEKAHYGSATYSRMYNYLLVSNKKYFDNLSKNN